MQQDSYGVFTDGYGTRFTTPDGKAPSSYCPITVHNGDGTGSAGSWLGSAVKN